MKSFELVGEETAKAVQETAKATGKTVDLLSKLGDSATGKATSVAVAEVAGLFGDWVHRKREKYSGQVVDRARIIYQARNIALPSPDTDVPLSILEPLLEAAVRESRPELQDMWARLLAAAVDPKRAGQVRLEFIETVKHLESLDAAVLERLQTPMHYAPSAQDFMARALDASPDEIEVAFQSLHRILCFRNSCRALTSLKGSPRRRRRGAEMTV